MFGKMGISKRTSPQKVHSVLSALLTVTLFIGIAALLTKKSLEFEISCLRYPSILDPSM